MSSNAVTQRGFVDRHVPSDTRFSRGMWELKSSVVIKWANDVVKQDIFNGGVYTLTGTDPIRNRGDTLNNPSISTKLESPIEGVVKGEAYHHYSAYKNNGEPRFEVADDSEYSAKVTRGPNHVQVDAGKGLTAKIDSKKFGIRYEGSDGKFLTELGFRSVGWVQDNRYPDIKTGSALTFTTLQFHLSVGEKVYGLGERFGPFEKNGQRVEMWNEDGGTSSEWTYKNIPFYISNRGYGVFIDSSADVVFEIQSERTTRVNVTIPSEGARWYVIYGPTPKEILHKYAQLTGFPALPPAWTFGLWLTTSFTTDYDIKTVSSFISGMKDRDIPLRTFHFDCFWMKEFQWCDFNWDADMFPDPAAMLKQLKKDFGIKVCVWINSYIGQESALFKEADEKKYLIRNTTGSLYQTDLWQAGMGIVDFTNPDAYKWFQVQLEKLIDIGVDSFKTDFGERIPCIGVEYHNGKDPVAMHNYYTLLYNKCVFEVLEKRLGKNEACLFARSATVGGQQFPVHWGGDCESSFEAMAESLRGGLSLCLSGFGFWSHDIGGFEGLRPEPAVYKRWCAFGLLSSHSRLHGSSSYRVPWLFDEEACDVLRKFTKLKLELMPYIYNLAITAHETATPVMRAMLLEFPDEKESYNADTQFMLGDSLLVAPVFNAEGDVSFFVPKGEWYGYLDGKKRVSNGQWFEEKHDFSSLPLLVKEGSVFVTGPEGISVPDYDYSQEFVVNIYKSFGSQTVKIPDYKKPGKFVSEVTIATSDDSIKVNVSTKGKWLVKLLGVSSTQSDFKSDSLGNAVVEASGKSLEIKLL